MATWTGLEKGNSDKKEMTMRRNYFKQGSTFKCFRKKKLSARFPTVKLNPEKLISQ